MELVLSLQTLVAAGADLELCSSNSNTCSSSSTGGCIVTQQQTGF